MAVYADVYIYYIISTHIYILYMCVDVYIISAMAVYADVYIYYINVHNNEL